MNSSLIKLISLPKITDIRGSLTFVEGGGLIPFDIKRVYYLYGVPPTLARGGHAHYNLQQAVIAVSGSFEFILDDGKGLREKVLLDSPDKALLISNLTWREMENFSNNAVCLVLASEKYSASDYIRDYAEFKKFVNAGKN